MNFLMNLSIGQFVFILDAILLSILGIIEAKETLGFEWLGSPIKQWLGATSHFFHNFL